MRILAGVMAVLFAYAAALQYNDPDPAIWIAIYTAAGAISAMLLLGKDPRFAAAIVAVVAAGWSATLIAPSAAANFSVDNEEVRELGGLTIVSLWCAAVALRSFLLARRTARAH